MTKALRYLLIFAFVLVALFAFSQFATENAEAADCTWVGGAPSTASSNGLWQNGTAPTTGDNVYFTSGSAACTWDITATVNYITTRSGYTGTITQGNNINVGARGIYLASVGGTITGSISYWITTTGDFIRTVDNTVTSNLIKLNLTGTTKLLTLAGCNLNSIAITGTISYSGSGLHTNLYIWPTGIFTLNSDFKMRPGFIFINSGQLIGNNYIQYYIEDASRTLTFNIISCPIKIYGSSSMTNSFIVSLTKNENVNSVWIYSDTVGKTVTINTIGYSLSCTSLTIGTRGILLGSGSVSCSANFDSYNGTTSGSWSLTMTGTSPYIKTPAGNTINGLTIQTTNLRLASGLNVTKTFTVNGGYTLGSKTITVGTGTNVTVASGSSWTLMGQTRYWGKVNITGSLLSAVPVSVWCNGSSAVNGSVASTIILHSNAFFTFRGTVGKLYLEQAFRSTFYANGTWERIFWNTTGAWTFRPSITPTVGDVQSKSTMTIVTESTHYITFSNTNNYAFIVHINQWNVLNSLYGWQLTNLGAVSIYQYHMSIFTSATQMSLFVDNMFENTYTVAANGYLEIYDTEDTNYEEQYNLVPGAQTVLAEAIDWNQAYLVVGILIFLVSIIVAFGLVTKNGPAVTFGGLILLIGAVLALSDYGIFTTGMASMAGVFLMLVGAVRD